KAYKELLADFESQPEATYVSKINRLNVNENEELQHDCGRMPPKPVINYCVNMTTSQFVVGIGMFLNYPMHFGHGPWCSGVIISKRHVITADHCVEVSRHQPHRYYVSYGSNCFNPIFSRNNFRSYHTRAQVPCGNSKQRIALAKHIIAQTHQKYQRNCLNVINNSENPPKSERGGAWGNSNIRAGDFVILELREDIVFDSLTSPICMPRRQQEYANNIVISIYGVGGARYDNQSKQKKTTAKGNNYTSNNKTTSQGDSGGPWVRKSVDQQLVLVAVTSSGGNIYRVDEPTPHLVSISAAPALEYESDFICKWTGVCPDG
ncbi:hypothetical protein PMAYCL1PPCAC_26924, partial [Pristionchus mayeri]